MLLAQHGNRRIARLEANGSQTALATHYNGKRLNSPNDIAVKSDGAIFFTDPPYGISSSQQAVVLKNERLAAGVHQVFWNAGRFANGVYFYVLQAGMAIKIGKAVLLK